MKKTVTELMQMYAQGKLHADQTTQRNFLYGTTLTDEYDGEISKAGAVIKSILERGIQLPALYFWNVQDAVEGVKYAEDEFNIHDGKQRFLSIYKFIREEDGVTTRLNGIEHTFSTLSDEQKNKLLNYELDIVTRVGTLREEEESFRLINRSGLPLTPYEGLRGAYHGKYMTEFENYMNEKARTSDVILKVGESRGRQAFWALCASLGIIWASGNNRKLEDKKKLEQLASDRLQRMRNQSFDQINFSKVMDFYLDFGTISKFSGGNEKNPQKLWAIAMYVTQKKLDKAVIIGYYQECLKKDNDIDRWTYDVHLAAIDNLSKDIRNDARRFFNTAEKSELYKKTQKCACCGTVFPFNELEVDHIKPWSKGGRTNMENARLLCKSCNSSKGAK